MHDDSNSDDDLLALCEAYGPNLCALLVALLESAQIKVHSVSYRVKTQDSLRRKLEIKSHKYSSIRDITDLLGIRIITYFRDDVDKVAKVVEREFAIDYENSVDKSAVIDPDPIWLHIGPLRWVTFIKPQQTT